MKIRRSCREVTHLVLQAGDRRLGLGETISLRLHWLACGACTRFRDQTRVARVAIDRWRGYRDNE